MGHQTGNVLLFGIPVASVTSKQAVVQIEHLILSGRSHQVATANLDFARHALTDSYAQRILCDCSLVVADGAPIVWASHLLGASLPERVTGVDLVPQLAALSAAKGYSIFLLGSSEQNSSRAESSLRRLYPGVNIAGRYSPEIQALDEMDDEEILRRIHEVRPDILLVAFGHPKQEKWIHRNLKRMGVPVSIGIGGALDLIAGDLQRAPRWMRVSGLEWAFRAAQEPRRLLPRYAKDAAVFLTYLPIAMLAASYKPRSSGDAEFVSFVQGESYVIRTPATLSGSRCLLLMDQVQTAVSLDLTPVVDFSSTVHVGLDGLATLLEARRVLRGCGRQMLLVCMSKPIQRICRMSSIWDILLVMEASSPMGLREPQSSAWSRERIGRRPYLSGSARLS